MKQPKGMERSATRNRRPSKPPAGEVRRRHAAVPPYAGPVKGDQARPDPTRSAKPAFDPDAAARTQQPAGEWPDQQAAQPRQTGDPQEQYVRLRIRVRGDRLTVVESHLVDGPLAQSTTFHGANAYEVTYDDRLLHAGTVTDPATQRSFPSLDGPEELRGHNVTPREIYEFTARVPAADVTEETRSGIHVRLHRIDDPASTDRLGAAPLGDQLEGRLTQVAELVGLPESTLPEAIEARGGRTATGR
ncbi:hypothetical protein EV137_6867 [Kribbella pratensis]|uniref:Uncharacterized protein n=1 Tax=Kribbella pratensis TaxID=2512112 RepID=A0ABY2F6Q6_9ACTN|nr:hypothetical protein [Kribbella pratensis]TDW84063.1 hypothetical protein EV137_6867 [Kribbella pratensis]